MPRRRHNSAPMTALERRAVFSLAGIFGLRIFGLFLILPVFAIYALDLEQATPFLVGLTLGAYGLTQAILQIPFGLLSDRWDRKKTIVLGLLIFAIGSVIAGISDSIYGVLIGRFIQGAGAISAVVIALMSDLTREAQRIKAMAIIGVGIGVVFMASMILGPVFSAWFGVKGIFFLTAITALLAIPVLLKITPEPKKIQRAQQGKTSIGQQIKQVISRPQLLQLDFGIFTLHAVLTALFVVIPFRLIELSGLAQNAHWKVYISVMLLGVIGMLPFIAASHQREKIPTLMRIAVLILCAAALVLLLSEQENWWAFLAGLALFFVGFNTMEATLPSLVSRVAPIVSKGAALGVYNSAQFLGVFVGGAISGYLFGEYGASKVFLFCLLMLILWLLMLLLTPRYALHETKLIRLKSNSDFAFGEENGQSNEKAVQEYETLLTKINNIAGVLETSRVRDEAMAYVKVDPPNFDLAKFEKISGQTW